MRRHGDVNRRAVDPANRRARAVAKRRQRRQLTKVALARDLRRVHDVLVHERRVRVQPHDEPLVHHRRERVRDVREQHAVDHPAEFDGDAAAERRRDVHVSIHVHERNLPVLRGSHLVHDDARDLRVMRDRVFVPGERAAVRDVQKPHDARGRSVDENARVRRESDGAIVQKLRVVPYERLSGWSSKAS
eukprot:29786-Pelagococcus_subviridis.AAC.1